MSDKKRNILNIGNGFNVIVNLWLMRYFFSHNKKGLEISQKNDFYKDILGMSRQRFHRMCSGQNFQISNELKKRISDRFNLDEVFLSANGKLIEIYGIDTEDWKYYFNYLYNTGFQIKEIHNVAKAKKKENIETVLRDTLKEEHIKSKYDVSHPLYRIYHYYKYGTAYKEESQLIKFQRELKKMNISDWRDILENEHALKEYVDLLDWHKQYLQAQLTVLKYRKSE